jgi:hypothetical protein
MERAFSPFSLFTSTVPGALPRADMVRAFGARVHSLRRGLAIGKIPIGPEARPIPSLAQRARYGNDDVLEG